MLSEVSAWSSETRRNPGDARDVRRMVHNPEVAGSNPAPATKARGPFSNGERAFRTWFANGYVNVALAQVARQTSMPYSTW
jgi:hypothetical protein